MGSLSGALALKLIISVLFDSSVTESKRKLCGNKQWGVLAICGNI